MSESEKADSIEKDASLIVAPALRPHRLLLEQQLRKQCGPLLTFLAQRISLLTALQCRDADIESLTKHSAYLRQVLRQNMIAPHEAAYLKTVVEDIIATYHDDPSLQSFFENLLLILSGLASETLSSSDREVDALALASQERDVCKDLSRELMAATSELMALPELTRLADNTLNLSDDVHIIFAKIAPIIEKIKAVRFTSASRDTQGLIEGAPTYDANGEPSDFYLLALEQMILKGDAEGISRLATMFVGKRMKEDQASSLFNALLVSGNIPSKDVIKLLSDSLSHAEWVQKNAVLQIRIECQNVNHRQSELFRIQDLLSVRIQTLSRSGFFPEREMKLLESELTQLSSLTRTVRSASLFYHAAHGAADLNSIRTEGENLVLWRGFEAYLGSERFEEGTCPDFANMKTQSFPQTVVVGALQKALEEQLIKGHTDKAGDLIRIAKESFGHSLVVPLWAH